MSLEIAMWIAIAFLIGILLASAANTAFYNRRGRRKSDK